MRKIRNLGYDKHRNCNYVMIVKMITFTGIRVTNLMRPTRSQPCNSRQSSLLCHNWASIEVHSVPAGVRMKKRCGNDSKEFLRFKMLSSLDQALF